MHATTCISCFPVFVQNTRMLLIGIGTALIACAIDICIELAAGTKFRVLQSVLDTSVQDENVSFCMQLFST